MSFFLVRNTRLFKKRPNFLNGAPTSIDSALRLLSAPSVRFWQKTVVSPVSLWALVVELHPLIWAPEQAARRISDQLTMKELDEQRVCVCVYVWNFAANLVKILQSLFNCKMHSSLWMGKVSPLQKKMHGWVGHRSRCWLCFLIGKALSIMNLYHVVRW